MRIPSHTRRVPLLALAFVLGSFAASLVWSVPSASAAGAANAQGREIVRLINGARAASGKSTLVIDTFLESKARDGAIPCPDNAAKSLPGRARDFSETGQMSHQLRLCDAPTYTLSSTLFISTVQKWGYGAVGEIDLVNGGYGFGKLAYAYKGFSTNTYATTAHAMTGWATSSAHWNIVMGAYDRVGCGAWSPAGSTLYYDCVFSKGGPNGVVAAPTKSPFGDPVVTPKPIITTAPVPPTAGRTPGTAPVQPAPVASVSVPGTVSPTLTPFQTGTPDASVTAVPTDEVKGVRAEASNAAPAIAAAAQQNGGNALGTTTAGPLPNDLSREAVLVFLASAALLVAFYVLLDRRRRRQTAENVIKRD